MTQDVVDATKGDNGKALIYPNREKFQAELDSCESKIVEKKKRLSNTCSSIFEITQNISKNNELIKKIREPWKAQEEQVKVKQSQLRTSKYELERQCLHRDMKRLEGCLARKEREYHDTVLNQAKHERILVAEIATLKANRANLSKLISITEEIKNNDLLLSSLKNESNIDRVNKLKNGNNKLKSDRNVLRKKCHGINEDIKALYAQKNELICKYKEKWTYWDLRNKKNKPSDYPSTFPSVHSTADENRINEDELEPFHEQKNDCRMLITYLERLESQRNLSDNLPKSCSENEDDSADDYPPLNQNLTIRPVSLHREKKMKSKTIKKTTSSKNKKLDNQPISHDLNYFKLFGKTNNNVPACYGNVKQVLDNVREQLALLNDKTNEVQWNEADYSSFSQTFSSCTTSVTDSAFGY